MIHCHSWGVSLRLDEILQVLMYKKRESRFLSFSPLHIHFTEEGNISISGGEECLWASFSFSFIPPFILSCKMNSFMVSVSWICSEDLCLAHSSVQFSSVVSHSLWPHGLQHARPPCSSPAPGVHPNPCPLSQWCHPTIPSSVIPFSSRLQSFPASGSFQMSQLFTSGGQRTGVSALMSVLPMNIQDWIPLGWTGWISLQSKGLSRVFSNTTVQKHQFFGAQLSL